MKSFVKPPVITVLLATSLSACGGGAGVSPITSLPAATTAVQSDVRTSGITTQAAWAANWGATSSKAIKRVLLISVDGMHAVDLQRFVAAHPNSAMATLVKHGTTYTNAHTPVPSDSFPGLLALTTGGHPSSTGVYYENNYDRTGYPAGSDCTGPQGTVVHLDESIDINPNDLHGGGGIDPAKLTRAKVDGACVPVFPHNYLRVNTLFEVVKANRGRTAWSDKEQSYEMLNGPSGHGVDDLYNLEIAAGGTTGSEVATQAYDNLKVAAILNQIDGKTSTGSAGAGVPTLFGMNFQAVSVGQKLAVDPASGLTGGYLDASGTPGPMLESALAYVDGALDRFGNELEKNGLLDSTLVVLTAKHGNQPIDRSVERSISDAGFATALAPNLTSGGFIQTDDLALIWLQDRSDANQDAALSSLRSIASSELFDQGHIFTGHDEPAGWGDQDDLRRPQFGIEPNAGVIYTTGKKISEHGGFRDDDTHVALIVASSATTPKTVTAPVQTAQVAPTILRALSIDPGSLRAVGLEGTQVLPR